MSHDFELGRNVSCKNLIWFETKLLRRQRLVSDARRNVRLYSTIMDRKSPLKGSRPSVPHGTNFFLLLTIALQYCTVFLPTLLDSSRRWHLKTVIRRHLPVYYTVILPSALLNFRHLLFWSLYMCLHMILLPLSKFHINWTICQWDRAKKTFLQNGIHLPYWICRDVMILRWMGSEFYVLNSVLNFNGDWSDFPVSTSVIPVIVFRCDADIHSAN